MSPLIRGHRGVTWSWLWLVLLLFTAVMSFVSAGDSEDRSSEESRGGNSDVDDGSSRPSSNNTTETFAFEKPAVIELPMNVPLPTTASLCQRSTFLVDKGNPHVMPRMEVVMFLPAFLSVMAVNLKVEVCLVEEGLKQITTCKSIDGGDSTVGGFFRQTTHFCSPEGNWRTLLATTFFDVPPSVGSGHRLEVSVIRKDTKLLPGESAVDHAAKERQMQNGLIDVDSSGRDLVIGAVQKPDGPSIPVGDADFAKAVRLAAVGNCFDFDYFVMWKEPSLYSGTYVARVLGAPTAYLVASVVLFFVWDRVGAFLERLSQAVSGRVFVARTALFGALTAAWFSFQTTVQRSPAFVLFRHRYSALRPNARDVESDVDLEAADDEDPDAPHCRVCFGSEPPLITPCACRGTAEFIHEACLREWTVRAVSSESSVRCDVCRTPYTVSFGPSVRQRVAYWCKQAPYRMFVAFRRVFFMYPMMILTIQAGVAIALDLQNCDPSAWWPSRLFPLIMWHLSNTTILRCVMTDLIYKVLSFFVHRRGWVHIVWGFPVSVPAYFFTVTVLLLFITTGKLTGFLWSDLPYTAGVPQVTEAAVVALFIAFPFILLVLQLATVLCIHLCPSWRRRRRGVAMGLAPDEQGGLGGGNIREEPDIEMGLMPPGDGDGGGGGGGDGGVGDNAANGGGGGLDAGADASPLGGRNIAVDADVHARLAMVDVE